MLTQQKRWKTILEMRVMCSCSWLIKVKWRKMKRNEMEWIFSLFDCSLIAKAYHKKQLRLLVNIFRKSSSRNRPGNRHECEFKKLIPLPSPSTLLPRPLQDLSLNALEPWSDFFCNRFLDVKKHFNCYFSFVQVSLRAQLFNRSWSNYSLVSFSPQIVQQQGQSLMDFHLKFKNSKRLDFKASTILGRKASCFKQ